MTIQHFVIRQIYLAYIPIYAIASPGEELNALLALARAREFIVDLIVSGIFRGPTEEITHYGEIDANQ